MEEARPRRPEERIHIEEIEKNLEIKGSVCRIPQKLKEKSWESREGGRKFLVKPITIPSMNLALSMCQTLF